MPDFDQSLPIILRSQRIFILKTYLMGIGLVALAVLQWLLLTTKKCVAQYLRKYNFMMLGLLFVMFVMLLLMQNLLRRTYSGKTRAAIACYMLLMIEITSTVVSKPVAQSTFWNMAMASALTLGPTTVSMCLAFKHQIEIEYEPTYLAMWTMKYFLLTSVSLPMVLAFDNIYVQTSISLLLSFFISILVIVWGISLSSLLFYRMESPHVVYYIALTYILFMSLFANTLVFFNKIRKIYGN